MFLRLLSRKTSFLPTRNEAMLFMRQLFLATVFAALALTASAASPTDLANSTVKDGDDVVIAGQDFRLADVDAFELRQTCKDGTPCGAKAREALIEIIGTQKVTCKPTGENFDRIIANCFVGDLNIGTEMVRRGWAVVRPDFAKGRSDTLCAIEAEAAAEKRGAWAHGFVAPFFVKNPEVEAEMVVTCPRASMP